MTIRHDARIPGGGERIWFNGALVTIRVAGDDAGDAFNLLEVVARASHTTPLHMDPNCETFHILEGEILFHIAGQGLRATANDTVVLPKGTPMRFSSFHLSFATCCLMFREAMTDFFALLVSRPPRRSSHRLVLRISLA